MLKKCFITLSALLFSLSASAFTDAVCCYSPNFAAEGSMWVFANGSEVRYACSEIDDEAYNAGNCDQYSAIYSPYYGMKKKLKFRSA